MADISNLGYVVLGVSDIERWEDFAFNIGLQVAAKSIDSLALRMDHYAQRMILEKGDEDDLRCAGWELDGVNQLDDFVHELQERGLTAELASAEFTANRAVQKLYRVKDPNEFIHEFYCGPNTHSLKNPFRSPTLHDGFNTGRLGVGHLLVRVPDPQLSLKFYIDLLQLRLSDRICEKMPDGRVVDVTFLHTKTGRHHSLAAGSIPGNKKLAHMMIEVNSMNDVGLAYDRCTKAGYPIQAELGRHPNDKMFSFYVVTPSGFAFEVGWGGIVIDDRKWCPTVYDRLSDWGHKRNLNTFAPSK